ncbi:MAG: hypothetical protein LBM64_07290 [Deltaproteobacteria bacterium]|jgi:hypothetical protein|nr:hypothetical protein [Deltaproteobacteria bacterium]
MSLKQKYSARELEGLARLAHYIWWKTPAEALRHPDRLVAQVMNIGFYEDVCRLIDLVGEKKLLDVLQHAEIGQFNERSWAYWHYRLTSIALEEIPPMPKRLYHETVPAQA